MPNQKGPKKRGRPSKYATKEEKALADVERKRGKWQQEVSENRARECDQFYGVNLPSMLYSLPPPLSHGQTPIDLELRGEAALFSPDDMLG